MKYILSVAVLLFLISCSPKLSPDHYWSQKRWVLTEMKGVPVQLSGSSRDAYLEFSTQEKRFTGNGGCNRINGTYMLEKKDDIRFGEVMSTKMSCTDIAFETAFINALAEVDQFESENTRLLLKDGNKVVLILETK